MSRSRQRYRGQKHFGPGKAQVRGGSICAVLLCGPIFATELQPIIFSSNDGALKANLDKIGSEMAVDFKDCNVASVSLWMGVLMTEHVKLLIDEGSEKYKLFGQGMAAPEFTGNVIC